MFTCIVISSNYVLKKKVASHFAKHLAETQVWCSEATWLWLHLTKTGLDFRIRILESSEPISQPRFCMVGNRPVAAW